MYRHLTYLALLLITCVFLVSPATAEVACEDMPCCVGLVDEAAPSDDCKPEESSQKLMTCGDSVDEGCSCSIQSQAPVTESPEAIITFVSYEFLAKEIDVLELPEALLDLPEEKPSWFTTDQVPRDDFFLPLSTFPNPPPAAA